MPMVSLFFAAVILAVLAGLSVPETPYVALPRSRGPVAHARGLDDAELAALTLGHHGQRLAVGGGVEDLYPPRCSLCRVRCDAMAHDIALCDIDPPRVEPLLGGDLFHSDGRCVRRQQRGGTDRLGRSSPRGTEHGSATGSCSSSRLPHAVSRALSKPPAALRKGNLPRLEQAGRTRQRELTAARVAAFTCTPHQRHQPALLNHDLMVGRGCVTPLYSHRSHWRCTTRRDR